MYRIQIKEGNNKKYWTNKVPMEFNESHSPLEFKKEEQARECFKGHFPLFVRYMELTGEKITYIKIINVVDSKILSETNFFEEGKNNEK